MASIHKRQYESGHFVWRLKVTRKGVPSLYLSFDTYEDARKWELEEEEKYCKSPHKYLKEIVPIRKEINRKRRWRRNNFSLEE